MSGRSVPLPSPAMAVAVCALFVALGGASYALTLPRDSVGPRQLRARAVTSTKLGTGAVTVRALRDGAVSGRKIASGSVRASDLGGGAVRTAALANGAVTAAKLAPDSVTAAQLSLPIASVQAFSPVLPANGNLRESGDLPGGRHYAIWDAPWPKPAYLFALVGGKLGHIQDSLPIASVKRSPQCCPPTSPGFV